MKVEEITDLFNRFEAVAAECQGVECWSARELQPLLGYSKWENFCKVIDKAKESALNSDKKTKSDAETLSKHFPDVRKMVSIGYGVDREIDDILLTRYACYLIAQNGDPSKKEISFAQNYFAIQTRKAELVAQLKRRFGVPGTRPVADFLPTVSIKAKDFAAAMTAEDVKKVERRLGTDNKKVEL